ncbi:MAG: hypothetical protein JO209_07295 [Acidisphaera sp.]|nr:hypothetical protein [Acidisphaera sp.]
MIRAALSGLVVAAALAGVITVELRSGAPVHGGTPAVLATSAPAIAGTPAPAQAAWDALVATILARPLFSVSRRPAQESPVAADQTASALPRVAGVLVGPSQRIAIFAAADGQNKPTVVAEGDRVAGFLVRSIAPGEVTLLGPQGTRVLRPSFAGGSPATDEEAALPRLTGPRATPPSAPTEPGP